MEQLTTKLQIKNQLKTVNRRYPAEWEKQRTTWLTWPHNIKEWGEKRLPKIREFYAKLIKIILQFQNVNLILADEEMLNKVGAYCNTPVQGKKFKLREIIIPNNDIWIRDYGPYFMSCRGEVTSPLLLDFEFNGWGGKFPPWDLDNNIPKQIALYKGCEIESYPIILEGGAVEFSGNGLILTTKQCLLSKNRNPDLNKNQIETILKSAFNIEDVIWLKRGLEGDHTDGHIDNVARFISPTKVLICKSNNKNDANHDHLNENIEYLKNWQHPQKRYKLEVIELPLPDRASYANFIFVNGGIIVPMFDCKTDKIVLNIFKKLFPKRKVTGIDCSLLVQEGGGLHCMTKQEPLL